MVCLVVVAADGLFSESLDAFRSRDARHARLFSREDPEDPCGCFYIFQDLSLAKYDIARWEFPGCRFGVRLVILFLNHGLWAYKI